MAPKHKGGEKEEYAAAQEAVLAAERALAAARKEPYAVRIDFPVMWSTGAPMPHLLRNDYKMFLVFYEQDYDPNWDGTYTTLREPASEDASALAIVEFHGCVSAKLGGPNDEALNGHTLYGKGLEFYEAMRVENSPWIKELETANSRHQGYNPARWRGLTHYFLGFHDNTFECVANSFTVESRRATLPAVLAEVCGRLVR